MSHQDFLILQIHRVLFHDQKERNSKVMNLNWQYLAHPTEKQAELSFLRNLYKVLQEEGKLVVYFPLSAVSIAHKQYTFYLAFWRAQRTMIVNGGNIK